MFAAAAADDDDDDGDSLLGEWMDLKEMRLLLLAAKPLLLDRGLKEGTEPNKTLCRSTEGLTSASDDNTSPNTCSISSYSSLVNLFTTTRLPLLLLP